MIVDRDTCGYIPSYHCIVKLYMLRMISYNAAAGAGLLRRRLTQLCVTRHLIVRLLVVGVTSIYPCILQLFHIVVHLDRIWRIQEEAA